MKNKEDENFSEKLKAFLHDPIDKCLDLALSRFKKGLENLKCPNFLERYNG